MFNKNENIGYGHQFDDSSKVNIYEYLMGGFVVLFLIKMVFWKDPKWFFSDEMVQCQKKAFSHTTMLLSDKIII